MSGFGCQVFPLAVGLKTDLTGLTNREILVLKGEEANPPEEEETHFPEPDKSTRGGQVSNIEFSAIRCLVTRTLKPSFRL